MLKCDADKLLVGKEPLDGLNKAELLAFAKNARTQYQIGERDYRSCRESLEIANDRLNDMRKIMVHIEEQLKYLKDKERFYDNAKAEIARLEGVLQGLERAGKIDPVPREITNSGSIDTINNRHWIDRHV